ncbi:hypothetical protein IMZ31_21745 (plasmid) [Pontibacillus sp. ALD_SL1]|uniref:hypothetical protein n=1 Tax=Pontibacillus sp. ALD_SL1 TaxID=2777185 RepID=UPI001A95F907|nr:hypothetical protein [Pontibacillus sp. ALD_SL1]QST02076.1 hypothetical protein IMZ31_21745 [Pontibacillus sp. ALD_SL1]
MIRGFLIAVLAGLIVGGGLHYYQNDHVYQTIIEVKTDPLVKDEFVRDAKVNVFPKLPLKFTSDLSGKGRFIYANSNFVPALVTIKAEGYKTKRTITLLKPEALHLYYLEPIEE